MSHSEALIVRIQNLAEVLGWSHQPCVRVAYHADRLQWHVELDAGQYVSDGADLNLALGGLRSELVKAVEANIADADSRLARLRTLVNAGLPE